MRPGRGGGGRQPYPLDAEAVDLVGKLLVPLALGGSVSPVGTVHAWGAILLGHDRHNSTCATEGTRWADSTTLTGLVRSWMIGIACACEAISTVKPVIWLHADGAGLAVRAGIILRRLADSSVFTVGAGRAVRDRVV